MECDDYNIPSALGLSNFKVDAEPVETCGATHAILLPAYRCQDENMRPMQHHEREGEKKAFIKS